MSGAVGSALPRALITSCRSAFKSTSTSRTVSLRSPYSNIQTWTCWECWSRLRTPSTARPVWQRMLSTSTRRPDETSERSIHPPTSPKPATAGESKEHTSSLDGASAPSALPSETAQHRSPLSKRTSELMDHVLTRLSLASQRINTYTGTDYSGIEAVRQEILAQEGKVRGDHKAVESARVSHVEALAQQASAQKEIVSLLERKSSWSPSDLERYMSLVRSEHTNEQAVQSGKEGLMTAEQDLERSRSLIERLERKRYHEEQIWSDTIRRNSTWVTFGLMGVNILLLLAQISIFEPYRRRKIVREVKEALDEKSFHHAPATGMEAQVDEVVEPAGVALESIDKPDAVKSPLVPSADDASKEAGESALAAGEVLPDEVIPPPESEAPEPVQTKPAGGFNEVWVACCNRARDLFSERIIQVRKVDLTTMALQGAATGVTVMGLVFILLRSR